MTQEDFEDRKTIKAALFSAPLWIPITVAVGFFFAVGMPWLYANFIPRTERDGNKVAIENRMDKLESAVKELTVSNAELKGTINTFMAFEGGKKK